MAKSQPVAPNLNLSLEIACYSVVNILIRSQFEHAKEGFHRSIR